MENVRRESSTIRSSVLTIDRGCGYLGQLELEPLIDRILADNPAQVAQYRGGKEGLLGFFVGQVMKETQGKANAKVVSELVRARFRA